MNAVFPISSANDASSTKKTSQFNQSDVGISKEMELHSCSIDEIWTKVAIDPI